MRSSTRGIAGRQGLYDVATGKMVHSTRRSPARRDRICQIPKKTASSRQGKIDFAKVKAAVDDIGCRAG